MLAGLPDADRRPAAVGQDGHPARAEDVEGLAEHLATGRRDRGGRIVGTVDPNVGAPGRRRRRSLLLRADRGHVLASQPRDEVVAGRVGRHAVLELPPEDASVEGDRRLGVRLGGVDPARDSGDVSVSVLGHRAPFVDLGSATLRWV